MQTAEFDPTRPYGDVDRWRELLRDFAERSGPVSDAEWRRLCLLAGIPPFPGDLLLT